MVNFASLYRDTGDIQWVLGLSGGKESTALTMHLLETMEKLPPPVRNRKQVYITCVKTPIELNPATYAVDRPNHSQRIRKI